MHKESLLYNDEKVRKTNMKFLFPKKGNFVELFKYSSKKSLTYFMYHNLLHKNRYIFDSLEEQDLSENVFFVIFKSELFVSTNLLVLKLRT